MVHALRATAKGGTVVCAGIHMSDIPAFPYDLLWGERAIRSVANLTRADGEAFLALAPRVPVRTHTHPLPLGSANDALAQMRSGRLTGAAQQLIFYSTREATKVRSRCVSVDTNGLPRVRIDSDTDPTNGC